MEASVSEIHGYPLRTEGFEEPLFPTRESKRAVAEHLLEAPWLFRASEVEGSFADGQAVHARREPVELESCGRCWEMSLLRRLISQLLSPRKRNEECPLSDRCNSYNTYQR